MITAVTCTRPQRCHCRNHQATCCISSSFTTAITSYFTAKLILATFPCGRRALCPWQRRTWMTMETSISTTLTQMALLPATTSRTIFSTPSSSQHVLPSDSVSWASPSSPPSTSVSARSPPQGGLVFSTGSDTLSTPLTIFKRSQGLGAPSSDPVPLPLCPWSHYVPLFRRGPVFPGWSQSMWAEIMLSYPFFDRLEVLTRALAVTLDLALSTSSAFDLECSRSFATLFLPQFSTAINILERVLSPPSPSLLSNIHFGPLTVEDHEAALPPPPFTMALPPLASPPSSPPSPRHALTSCRRAGGTRRRFTKRLAIAPPSPRPYGASTFFLRGTRVRFVLSPPPFHRSSLGVLGFAAAFAAEPKDPP